MLCRRTVARTVNSSFTPIPTLVSCHQYCRTPVRPCVRCTNFIKLFSLHFVRHFDILSLIAVSVFLSSCTYLPRHSAQLSLVHKCTQRAPHPARSPFGCTSQCLQPLGARQRPAYFIHCCTFFPFLLCVSHSSTSQRHTQAALSPIFFYVLPTQPACSVINRTYRQIHCRYVVES